MVYKKFECYVKDVIRQRRLGFFPSLVKFFLRPLSWGYQGVVKVRNQLYDWELMRRYVPPVPLVISIGNIVAGGTGKTPVTLFIAKILSERYLVAILSRGYLSKAEKLDQSVIICEGDGPIFPASYCGDEPYLFAQRLPKVRVIVGKDRKKSALMASKAGVQVIILDDALQHRRLARDFDIIVVDVNDPFGQGYFLPRGFLRDDITALKRAHLIILNHVAHVDKVAKIKSKIQRFTSAPIICTNENVVAIRDLKGFELQEFADKRVGMFCGIANPTYFRKTLENYGFEVVNEYFIADHGHFHEKNLEQFAQDSLKKGANWLVCTEKDRVKLHEYLAVSLPIIWVQIDLQIVDGQEEWTRYLQQMESVI